jgi:hypothetical protein
MTGTGAYEQIAAYCQTVSGISTGTYNGDMIAAAKAATGLTRDMTANEAELLLLQNITGNTTSVLADMRGYWSAILAGVYSSGFILQEDDFEILLEDDSGSLLVE